MCGFPQFSVWIPIALAKMFFPHSHKPCKNTLVLVDTVLKHMGGRGNCGKHYRASKMFRDLGFGAEK